ncbi:hypothetical protein SanaruYs_06460 [Chryseotalea sanaruensis]|uniref:Uncharacterized protein n=1 Tax=Chryseotalea sanaruensis TaxID=2482724 RepID=A0A401U676_9BACT|nr:DUF4097 family beta strand repeat-containing protein [Chryseotalea sanaruensis]GCC50431.1 hypothetical protein SanaruYs_06460 [Chryseotalea sanaruensis]
MKLSNKILLGFFGLIFLYLNAAFIEIRLTGSPNIINDKNSITEKVDFNDITHLALNGLEKTVRVIGSDRPMLEVRSIKGDLLKKLKYVVSGDTLTLTGIDADDNRNFIVTVFVPIASFKSIHVNNSVVNFKDLQIPHLSIYQSKGRIAMNDCRIGTLALDVNTAFLNITDTSADTVSVNIETSTVNIYSSLIRLQGSIKNQTFLHIRDAQEIQLRKDESSNLVMYK